MCVYGCFAALYVSVDRRITLKSLKAALAPHVGTSVDNFKVVTAFFFHFQTLQTCDLFIIHCLLFQPKCTAQYLYFTFLLLPFIVVQR